jgi:uncharacterized membrane protein YebE (DUF533 family)
MFNARDLLGSLMQAGVSQSANDRLGHAMGPQGLGRADSPLGQILGQVLGGGQGQGQGGGLGDVLGGLMGKAGGMVGDATTAVKSGNPLAVGGLAALAGALLGGGGDAVKGALGGGLLAVLGGLAMNVLKNQASAGQGQPLGLRAPESAGEEAVLEERALVLIRAMVSAAKADGEIDPAERGRIAGQVKESGAGAEALEFLMAEMQRPQDVVGLVAQVRGPEEAVAVYAASLLAIEVDTAAERDYLARLSRSLGLDADAVGEVHRTLGAPQLA